MALPHFLQTSYRYIRLAGVLDVQTIMDQLCTELVALGWSITAGGVGVTPTTFKSGIVVGDSVDCFVTVTFTRTSAVRLKIECFDGYGIRMNGTTTACEVDVDAGGNFVALLTGQNHLVIDSEKGGGFETFYVAIIDKYPEPKGVPNAQFICSQGPRRSDTGALYNQTLQYVYNLAPGESSYGNVNKLVEYLITTNTVYHVTHTGKYRVIPQEVMGAMSGPLAAKGWIGRVPHMVRFDANFADGADVTVPVDVGVNATFRVVGLDTVNNAKIGFTKAIV